MYRHAQTDWHLHRVDPCREVGGRPVLDGPSGTTNQALPVLSPEAALTRVSFLEGQQGREWVEGKVQWKVVSSFSACRLQAPGKERPFPESQHRELTVHSSAGGDVCLDSGLPRGPGEGRSPDPGEGLAGAGTPSCQLVYGCSEQGLRA